MKHLSYFIPILAGLSLTPAIYATPTSCPDLDNLSRPDELSSKLGFGADSDREVIKQISCLNYTENFLDDGEARINSAVISNYDDVYKKFKFTTNTSASFFVFKASLDTTYENIFHTKKFEKSFVLDYDIKFGTADATLNSNNPLNQMGNKLSNNACDFKKFCGNNYVCQTDKGANVSVKLDFQFSSLYAKNEFTANASAGIEGLEICCKPFSASFSSSINKLSETTRKNSSVRLEAIQRGGYVEQLSRILGGSYVYTCSLDKLNDCTAALDAIAQYVSSEDLIAGVREKPAVMAYKNCPYEAIYGVPDLPNEVTKAVQTARTQLGDKYLDLLADRETLLQTLSLSLTPERRQQLEDLLVILESEAKTVQKTGEFCMNDLTHCPQKAMQTLVGLQTYDRTVLHPNATDGLVAYYPFNGNSLDESGNGNDGTVYGASLIEDRNDQKNNAFSFNNSETYISIDHRKSLNSDKFTVTGWIYRGQNCPITSDSCMIFNKEDSYELAIRRPENTLQIGIWPFNPNANWGWINTNIIVPQMQWVHVALTYNGSEVVAYMNNASYSFPQNRFNKSTYPFLIGNRSKYANSPYVGSIDDIRIYNRALTSHEIQQLYQTTDTQSNQAPFTIFTTSITQTTAPLTVNLDASNSSDADGNIIGYDWQTSNGQQANGKTANFSFNQAGTYTINLTVTDDQGATSTATKPITILTSSNSQASNDKTYQLTVNTIGNGTIQGAGQYVPNSTANLSAIADKGSKFQSWSGDCQGQTTSTSVFMDNHKTCVATFETASSNPTQSPPVESSLIDECNPFLPCFTLTVNSVDNGIVKGMGKYAGNTEATLSAIADTGYQFTSWTGDCRGTENPLTISMVANKTCQAVFDLVSDDKCEGDMFGIPCQPLSPQCNAVYEKGLLTIPCLNLQDKTYQVDLKQTSGTTIFDVDMNTLTSKTFSKNACSAAYDTMTGEAHIPCVDIIGTENRYDIYLIQQPKTLRFDLAPNRIKKVH